MLLDVESNLENRGVVFDDVLDFCIKTDVCKTLNMSFVEIYTTLDMATYTRIKEVIQKENERKSEILTKAQKESQDRSQAILGSRYGRR